MIWWARYWSLWLCIHFCSDLMQDYFLLTYYELENQRASLDRALYDFRKYGSE